MTNEPASGAQSAENPCRPTGQEVPTLSPSRKRAPAADRKPPRVAPRSIEGATPGERTEWGRGVRKDVPRAALGSWAPARDRPDPVALLLEQSAARVPDLVPIRHGRMLVSPFAFYRGGALVMAADLARAPSSGIYVQACGDAHLSNFGMFATPERTMAFDINDFDETHPAPFEWDVMRLVASIVVAAYDISLGREAGRRLATHAAERYRKQVRMLSGMRFLDVWYSHVDVHGRAEIARQAYSKSQQKRAAKAVKKAQRKTNVGALDRLAERVDGRWHIKDDPPLIVHRDLTPERMQNLRAFFEQYASTLPRDLRPLIRHYKVADFARKVVGVGSVGTEAHVALLIGTRGDDALFLQIKEATDSVLERYVVSDVFEHQGERVVFGQRLMQASSDLFLGHASSPTSLRKRTDFYVRQLNDYKSSADIAGMDETALGNYVEVCAEALARAHARSGSANAITGYLGKGRALDKAMGSFAVAYADQNKEDFEAFAQAGKDGTMEVVSGV
jgi:uncharacterized protein (DUF2252 family)